MIQSIELKPSKDYLTKPAFPGNQNYIYLKVHGC